MYLHGEQFTECFVACSLYLWLIKCPTSESCNARRRQAIILFSVIFHVTYSFYTYGEKKSISDVWYIYGHLVFCIQPPRLNAYFDASLIWLKINDYYYVLVALEIQFDYNYKTTTTTTTFWRLWFSYINSFVAVWYLMESQYYFAHSLLTSSGSSMFRCLWYVCENRV